jgi:hypothetical protein
MIMEQRTQSGSNGQCTVFGSLSSYVKGDLEILEGDPKHYVFSNVFEVASKAKPYEKVAVALNLGYVIEALRAEGCSEWFAASHDEFAIVMDGHVTVELIQLEEPDVVAPSGVHGTVRVVGTPRGRKMGRIIAGRGHQVLLPKGAAYRFQADRPGVLLLQTILGQLTVQKWRQICYS